MIEYIEIVQRTHVEKFAYLVQDRLTSSDCLGVIALSEGGVICSAFKLACESSSTTKRMLALLLYRKKETKKPQEYAWTVKASLTAEKFDGKCPVQITFADWLQGLDNSDELSQLVMKVFVNAIFEYCKRLLCRQLVMCNKKVKTLAQLGVATCTTQVNFGGGRILVFCAPGFDIYLICF